MENQKQLNLKEIYQHLETLYEQIKTDGINIWTEEGLDEFKGAVYDAQERLEAIEEQADKQADYIDELEDFMTDNIADSYYWYGIALQEAEDRNATEEEIDSINHFEHLDYEFLPNTDLPNTDEIFNSVFEWAHDTMPQEEIDKRIEAGRLQAKKENPEMYPEYQL